MLAAAFPAAGRTNRDGRLLSMAVRSRKQTSGDADHNYPKADLVDVLATAGVRSGEVLLTAVRSGQLKAILAGLAAEANAVAVCDAEMKRPAA